MLLKRCARNGDEFVSVGRSHFQKEGGDMGNVELEQTGLSQTDGVTHLECRALR
jgi:hypothetical protein